MSKMLKDLLTLQLKNSNKEKLLTDIQEQQLLKLADWTLANFGLTKLQKIFFHKLQH